ncbi:Eisosome assembly protein [Lithohypha guttulata]|uniref:Eisosome assembly protein n=1 Tax=Lithohypha guttulata TaxID=1690604 RepID=A0AAN7Y999_9EURO|nr:Eisosome assembly protein [Lithohypha guttulata]
MTDNVGVKPSSASILGKDGKLSSASAAQSLKYAKAQDLPSYPSTGGVQLSSAGAAASLANSNRKSFEHWTPGPIPAANKAAMLAKDHKMDPLWQPEASAAGAGAALKAHANPTEVEPIQKRAPTKSATPSAAYDTQEDSHRKAMMAATAVHNRRRSGSLPTQPVVKPADNAAWALKAATKSQASVKAHADTPAQPSQAFASGDPGFEAARIQNIAKNNVNRQMYTASPPVSIEVQEKNRQDTLRASAVAMAQKMYAIQQQHLDEAAGKSDGHALAASRARSSTITGAESATVSDAQAARSGGYENLEEAARKLAQERLAKIHDENAEYRNYYGATSPQRRSRLSMRRDRRPSNVADDDSDEEQSRRIKSQMSIFQSKLAEVDTKKRQQDRDALLQIAHRNVDSQIQKMDEKVFESTGKASPAQMEKWEKSAREKAQRDSDERMQHVGKVHIGGGKYLDQSELDAIARARLQPTLDDITEKAEKQRALDEERRMDLERQRQQAEREKIRSAETAAQVKAEHGQSTSHSVKAELILCIEREKAAARTLKEQEKERARQEKEEKRRSKEPKSGLLSSFRGRGNAASGTTGGETAGADATAADAVPASNGLPNDLPRAEDTGEGETVHDQVTYPTAESSSPVITASQEAPTTSIANKDEAEVAQPALSSSLEGPGTAENRISTEQEADPTSPNRSGVRSWMKVKFGRRSDAQENTAPRPVLAQTDKDKTAKGAEVPRTDSMRDVAMAGRSSTSETQDMYGTGVSPEPTAVNQSSHVTRERSPSISSLSSDSSHDKNLGPDNNFNLGTTSNESETRGRSGFRNKLMKKIKPSKDKPKEEGKAVTPVLSNTSDDEFEEARDTFDEETMAPPPPLSSSAGENSKEKVVTPKGSRDGSRFTEVL